MLGDKVAMQWVLEYAEEGWLAQGRDRRLVREAVIVQARALFADRAISAEVELVTADGKPLGSCEKLAAHQPPGRLHRAFSAFLFDPAGRVLLQRRADSKYHFGGRWTNACCGHPAPGADVVSQGERRTFAELGVRVTLTVAGSFTYRAADAASGLVEHELDTVLVGRLRSGSVLVPDPAEVAETRYVSLEDLAVELAHNPETFTPWFTEALPLAVRHAH